jgi:SAM-dependent methyltransferase
VAEPKADQAVAKYRRHASGYDRRAARWDRFRRLAIERLLLSAGETVLDVACGTGIAFPLLETYVGSSGKIVGIDVSPDMLGEAHRRVEAQGWRNVDLVEATIEDAAIPTPADAALFSLAHDVLRSPGAVHKVVDSVKPGGRVASFGGKWAPWWSLPVNAYVWLTARRYVTTFEGFRSPWDLLQRFVPGLVVESVALGGAYIAWGTVPSGRVGER